MQINTFTGSDNNMDVAVTEAEEQAQDFLATLASDALISVQAQSLIDRWQDEGGNYHTCFHIITIVSQ